MEIKQGKPFNLLPPKEDCCQECATKHAATEPHNRGTLYYQMKFQMEHERSPTWEDAMEHCPEVVKVAWREHLESVGVKPE